jgi:hypothetical protein
LTTQLTASFKKQQPGRRFTVMAPNMALIEPGLGLTPGQWQANVDAHRKGADRVNAPDATP